MFLVGLDEHIRRTGRTSAEFRRRLESEIDEAVSDWINAETLLLESTASSAGGDSGRPLLDSDGRIAGVCFGGLSRPEAVETRSYYVHREEIANFLESKPDSPMLEIVVDPWHVTRTSYEVHDLTQDGNDDLLFGYSLSPTDVPVLAALDLDGDNDLTAVTDKLPISEPIAALFAGPKPDSRIVVYRSGLVSSVGADRQIQWIGDVEVPITAAASSADRSLVVVGTLSGKLTVIDASSGQVVQRHQLGQGVLTAAAMGSSNDSVWVASFNNMDGSATVQHMRMDGDVQVAFQEDRAVIDIDVAPSGEFVTATMFDGPVRLYDAETGKPVWSNEELRAFKVRFHPSGNHVVTSPMQFGPELSWLAVADGKLERKLSLKGIPWAFAFSKDGSRVCAHLSNEALYVAHDSTTGESLGAWQLPQADDALAEVAQAATGRRPPPIDRFSFLDDRVLTGDETGRLIEFALDGEEVQAYRITVPQVDVEALEKQRAFDAEFAFVLDNTTETLYAIYDLDNDSRFEVVRLDTDGDGEIDSEYRADETGYRKQENLQPGFILLAPEQLPEAWQGMYKEFLSAFFDVAETETEENE